MPSPGFILEFYLKASPDKVMSLLTDSEVISDWSRGEALVEKKVGGQMAMFDGWVEGKILKITGNELAYTWKPSNWPEEVSASEVYYTLAAEGKGTRIVLEHTHFPDSKEMESHKSGWSEEFFDLIEDYLGE
ncbi:MAG: SRPBCC domain-containing protein [Chitinophagaceae bacterium]